MIKIISIIIGIILFTSCAQGEEGSKQKKDVSNSPSSPVFLPATNKDKTKALEKEAAQTPMKEWIGIIDPYYVLHFPESLPSISMYDTWTKSMVTNTIPKISCSPSTLGVSAPLTLTGANGNAVWGRVDLWDTLIGEADPRPIPKCIPPFPHDSRSYFPCTDSGDIMSIPLKDLCASRQRQYEIDHGMYAAYTLCAQKEEKAVLICISQVKDNPTLAQKIFETFRWKE